MEKGELKVIINYKKIAQYLKNINYFCSKGEKENAFKYIRKLEIHLENAVLTYEDETLGD